MNENKYMLEIGIHNGTLVSRDSEQPKFYDTEDEALSEFYKARTWYRSIGYMIWYAYLTNPDGNKRVLETNSYR